MNKKLYRILSIDGGGARSLIPGQILALFEDKIREKTNDPNVALSTYFDMIVGTSAGGLLTALLTTPKEQGSREPRYTAQDLKPILLRSLPEIFYAPLSYRLGNLFGLRDEQFPSDGIKRVCLEHTENFYLSDLILPSVITSYDVKGRKTRFFSSCSAQGDPERDFLVRSVCQASSAAPTFFEAVDVVSRTGVHYPCIDGGVFASSPAYCALQEACKHFQVNTDQLLLLSLGTGQAKHVYFHDEIKDYGALEWIIPLIRFLLDSNAETTDYFCRLNFQTSNLPHNYLRLNPLLTRMSREINTTLSNVSQGNMMTYVELATEYIESHEQKVDDFIDLLINQGPRE